MRDKLWYLLNDPSGEIAEIERRLDRLDIEIDGRRRLAAEANRARLARLGVDVSNYKLAPHIHPSELRCANHLRPDDDVEALVREAKESKLDCAYREHITRTEPGPHDETPEDTGGQLLVRRGIGQVLGVR